jgi:hypothetical protein
MNWKLIFQLSLFGLAMAFATVFLIPPTIEPAFWLPIFLFCGYAIAKQTSTHRFQHGVLLGLVNCVWITSAHLIFFDHYVLRHPQEATMLQSAPATISPKLLMAVTGTLVGLISGIVIGVLAFAAAKLTAKKA